MLSSGSCFNTVFKDEDLLYLLSNVYYYDSFIIDYTEHSL
jgi:hypothetical protein